MGVKFDVVFEEAQAREDGVVVGFGVDEDEFAGERDDEDAIVVGDEGGMVAEGIFVVLPDRFEAGGDVEAIQSLVGGAEEAVVGDDGSCGFGFEVGECGGGLTGDFFGGAGVKACAVVFGGDEEAVCEGDGCGNVEVAFDRRNDLPEAFAGFWIPAAEGEFVVADDLTMAGDRSGNES